MDPDEFWGVVEAARADSLLADDAFAAQLTAPHAEGALDAAGRSYHDALTARLKPMSPEELCAFGRAHDEARHRLYHWPLWGAGYLIGGGCSDDAFMDFRNGLIALGREWAERVLHDADELAAHPLVAAAAAREDKVLFYEELAYVPADVFELSTGRPRDDYYELYKRLRQDRPRLRSSPTGLDWDFDDRAETAGHLPRLTALFWPED